MKYILAFDIGVSSVGWAIIDEETGKVVESCSNIFPEANPLNNQVRRSMRQSKRLSRRLRTRLGDFNKLWKQYVHEIPQLKNNDIVGLKVKALYEVISIDEIYLILYSYLKHRGILYLEDAEDDNMTESSSYINGLKVNAKELETKFPCEIQKERLERVGKYRGQIQIIDKNGEKLDLSNVFTKAAYKKEIQQIFDIQKVGNKELTKEFCEKYLEIFERKRKYYEGPGNEKSRTDYGIYTTNLDATGKYITEKNIFEKLIGKCSVYPEEYRATTASYTAQEFNVLNDLNNLIVNGRKLEKEEKKKIIECIKVSDRVDVKKIIATTIGEKIEQLSGARIDKKTDKEEFHKFECYNKMRKALSKIDVNMEVFSRDELDEIGRILTLNTERDGMYEMFAESQIELSKEVMDCLFDVRKNNGHLFNKWHSFSLKIMKELIPEMYQQPKEQMTILTERGLIYTKVEEYKGKKYIPVDSVSEQIFNPVVRKAVRISLRILNELLKKYKKFDEIVIELPRDKNSKEEKERINDAQTKNEKEWEYIVEKLEHQYGLHIPALAYSKNRKLKTKLRLWNEQNGLCLYSGCPILPDDLIRCEDMFEIDHIIPRSISFDDSRSNKVLVYHTENQNKGNQTPYYYLTHRNKGWTFEQYRAVVIELCRKKEYGISKKKMQNLLFTENITKQEVLRGFINRNINDTGYAARIVLNTLQRFFKAQGVDTKIKIIKGSFTHQMRVNLNLIKKRDEGYNHHAVDAMLMGFSQLGYDAYRKLQREFIDFETGEILDKTMWKEKMSEEVFEKYLYGMRWMNIRQEIERAEKEVKYWHYVDYKCNRGLCNQTIRGTREYNGEVYKINKLDIRNKKEFAVFQKLAFSNKESDRERLLVYKHDRKTFDNLLQIMKDYADAENPFIQFEKETGDIVRKYSKKHNGPRIDKLKYTDGKVGSCIDISHKYGHEKGSKKVILENLNPYRMDVYYKEDQKAYYLVGVRQSDVKSKGDKYVIDEEAYKEVLIKEKMIKENQTRKDLQTLGFYFVYSFYKNDIIEYEKDEEIYLERFVSRTKPNNKNYIETKPIDKEKFEKQKQIGLGKTKSIKKYRMDILGNYYLCSKEKFSIYC